MHEMSNIKGKMIDQRIFEKEIKNMPDFLRKIVMLMSQRFNSAIDGSMELMSQLEETSSSIDSLSLSLIQERK